MSRVSKKESAHHNKVMELVYSDKQLTQVDRGFIFTNYRGGRYRATGASCMGFHTLRNRPTQITCVELNPEYGLSTR